MNILQVEQDSIFKIIHFSFVQSLMIWKQLTLQLIFWLLQSSINYVDFQLPQAI